MNTGTGCRPINLSNGVLYTVDSWMQKYRMETTKSAKKACTHLHGFSHPELMEFFKQDIHAHVYHRTHLAGQDARLMQGCHIAVEVKTFLASHHVIQSV